MFSKLLTSLLSRILEAMSFFMLPFDSGTLRFSFLKHTFNPRFRVRVFSRERAVGRLGPKARAAAQSPGSIEPPWPTPTVFLPDRTSGCHCGGPDSTRHGGLPQTHSGSGSPQQWASACRRSSHNRSHNSSHSLPALLVLEPHPPAAQLPRPCATLPYRKGRSGDWLRVDVSSRSSTRR